MSDLPQLATLFIVLVVLLGGGFATATRRKGRKQQSRSQQSRPTGPRRSPSGPRGGRPGGAPGGERPTGRGGAVPAPGSRTGTPSTRRGEPTRGRPHGADAGAPQRPGEIWWADVPFEDGPGSKVRPCVVLRTHQSGAEILKITSQDQRHRSDHIEIPTRTWDPDADHNSFLDLSDPIRVTTSAFQDRAGELDHAIWRHVCSLHGITR
ncbi:type II toxin-antitoxin system PemK/MazF family toxin [Microtetraspora malaysiensis]|uniref:Type II toxin-antitoxin system PemK/MazF family toxin n=1 Tax=Microtetraspora malaysiensis TaxID=161358 RepID=A0ABW6T437_9ACTN